MSPALSKPALALALAVAAVPCCAPQSASHSPYATPSESARSTVEAERLTRDAAAAADAGDDAAAERLLREALAADLYYGPAHNNLGALYLRAKPPKLYEAATEFEWACKLMPGNPDSRFNRGMAMELAGRRDDALAAYESALDVAGEFMPALQGLTSLEIRLGRPPSRKGALEAIALGGSDEQWRHWAKTQLLKNQ